MQRQPIHRQQQRQPPNPHADAPPRQPLPHRLHCPNHPTRHQQQIGQRHPDQRAIRKDGATQTYHQFPHNRQQEERRQQHRTRRRLAQGARAKPCQHPPDYIHHHKRGRPRRPQESQVKIMQRLVNHPYRRWPDPKFAIHHHRLDHKRNAPGQPKRHRQQLGTQPTSLKINRIQNRQRRHPALPLFPEQRAANCAVERQRKEDCRRVMGQHHRRLGRRQPVPEPLPLARPFIKEDHHQQIKRHRNG